MIYISKGLNTNELKAINQQGTDFNTLKALLNATTPMKVQGKDTELEEIKKGMPYFLGGTLRDISKGRNNANLVNRTLITLDFEAQANAKPMPYEDMLKMIHDKLSDYQYMAWGTIRNAPNSGRIRVVLAPPSPMDQAETQATTKQVYSLFPREYCDQSASTYSQLQGLPVDNGRLPYEVVINDTGKPYPIIADKKQEPTPAMQSFNPQSKGRIPKLLDQVYMEGIQEPGRNVFFTQAVGVLIKANVNAHAIYNLCVDWADNHCTPPFPHNELVNVINSVVKAEERNQRKGA